jgi:hypothetical protein
MQDDKFFNVMEDEVLENGDPVKGSDRKMSRDEHGQADNVKLEDLSWRAVKKLVEKNGGNWTNKAEGLMFLSKVESPDFEV